MPVLLIVLVSLFSHTFPNTTSIPIPSGSTLNFTVNLNNIQEARASNSNTITRPQGNGSDSPLLDRLSSVWIDPETKQTLANRLSKNTSSFLQEHKWSLICGTVITFYAYVCYIIASGNSYFAHKNLWSSWRQDLTLEQLLAIPQAQFAKELLQEIQRRYTDPTTLTDIVRPLAKFMQAIEEEEQELLWYQTAYSWIEYFKLNAIIPLRTAQFGKINERLSRIAYYKNVFHAWAAQYQMEQVHKARWHFDSDIPDVSGMAALMNYHYKISMLNYLAQKHFRSTPLA